MPDRPAAPPPPPADASEQQWTANLLEPQAPACAILGSMLYAELLARSAEDVRAGGPRVDVLQPHASQDLDSALALRLMAALHRLVLLDRAPQLARWYPPVGGTGDPDAAWPAFRAACAGHRQTHRFQRLRGALAIAADVPVDVVQPPLGRGCRNALPSRPQPRPPSSITRW